ncbi:hypothetical protein [Robertkochia aurantiaca]|uniref:hypothetical protein n=1 Tax=Robertkochia aurantiaca TaxID=2873700 RepID=UPI001CCD2666|nr:hypothetical protein [Robertkochia sp. 3YJGBD-33]
MNPCLLIPLLTGITAAIIGYFLGRVIRSGAVSRQYETLKHKNAELEKENEKLKTALSAARSNAAASASVAAASVHAFNSELARSVFGREVKKDDLKIIEGIGPQIENLLHRNGINTWAELAAASVGKCQEILDKGGKRFEIHDPETWPEQARLADEGKWKKLFEWQGKLDGGRL